MYYGYNVVLTYTSVVRQIIIHAKEEYLAPRPFLVIHKEWGGANLELASIKNSFEPYITLKLLGDEGGTNLE